jgi:DNA-binding response OmpR family regulator
MKKYCAVFMSITTSSPKKIIVLVAKDKVPYSQIITGLEEAGFTVVVTESVDETVSSGHLPIVVLVDYATCSSVCEESLHNWKFTGVPIIAVLHGADKETVERALLSGVADYGLITDSAEVFVLKIKAILDNADATKGGPVVDINNTVQVEANEVVRVYVIEDDPLLRNLLASLFEKYNFPFGFSHDGIGVVEKMKSFRPDVVVLDLMLPGRSGFDVLAEMQQHEELKLIPVVVFSNRDNSEDRARAKAMGVAHFHVKAITELSELIQILITAKHEVR